VVRDAFTLKVNSDDEQSLYASLTQMFRLAFSDIDKLGSFDDVTSGIEFGVLEVPYWAWREQLGAVRELLKANIKKHELIWPFLRDDLHLCHALISRTTFTVTPMLPLVNALPTFCEAPRRIYMSATIADDSEIVRTFDAGADAVSKALTSRSLAGISERMILIPELMPFQLDIQAAIKKILESIAKSKRGAVVLVSSNKSADKWTDVATLPTNAKDVETVVQSLQDGTTFGPVVFANRYDGIDLPGDACRLLVMDGLPAGTSDYELYKASALYGGGTITRLLAQRIEQGLGRGARGAGDHCVVLMAGGSLAAWIAKESNFRFLTSATRAQLEMGSETSKSVKDVKDLKDTIRKSINRDKNWMEYHAETLVELVDETPIETQRFELAAAERKAVDLWQDGHHEKAIAKIEKAIQSHKPDTQTTGWLKQLAARIADAWEHSSKAEELQTQAFASNRNLLRPRVLPPYRPLSVPGPQAKAIAAQLSEYRSRLGFLRAFDEAVIHLNKEATANQFEQALAELGIFIGIATERHDANGVGPDVLWLLPSKVGLVIEAKSRKKEANAFNKADHGQLLVAHQWFEKNYKGYSNVRVSVLPGNRATKAASAHASHALTYERLQMLVSDARALLARLCDSALEGDDLIVECAALLKSSPLREDKLVDKYLLPFVENEQ